MSGIFISYRRDDGSFIAGRLQDTLEAHFGPDQVFRDVEMLPGSHFGEKIKQMVATCDAVVAVIGDSWLGDDASTGRSRIHHPKDWVRQEIALALDRDIMVVPLLVNGVEMPPAEALPPSLRPLVDRNAMELSDFGWVDGVERLIEALEVVVKAPAAGQRSAQAVPPARRLSSSLPPGKAASSRSAGSAVGSVVTDQVFGREEEKAGIDRLIAGIRSGSAGLVVAGEAGIGKTTLWRAAVDAAEGRGCRVLVARPAESEARLSYTGLGDLLDPVADELLPALPEPQRRALEVALLRADDGGSPPDQRGVSVALLGVLRLLSAATPVLVAIDDVQWLDTSSARVLHFAVRRLGPLPVGVVVALRVVPGLVEPLDLVTGVAANRAWRIDVGPLSVTALHQVVRDQLGAGLAHPTLLRVHRSSGGNPFFAVELARALRGRESDLVPGRPLPVPEDLQGLVGARLADLTDDGHAAVQVVAAVAQPTTALLAAVLGPEADLGVREAVEAGVVRLEGDRLRLTHPLLGSVAYFKSSEEERRRLHRRIAGVVRDIEEEARHLALAADGANAAVANALDEAAEVAARRGAPDGAAELSELARRLTPASDSALARTRAIRAAERHYAAGDWRLAGTQLEGIIAGAPAGPDRAPALRLLGEIRYHDNYGQATGLLQQALAEAGDDDRLRASIELDLGHAILTTWGDIAAAGAHAESAVQHAERAREPGLLAAALGVAAFVDFAAGRTGGDRLARAVDLEDLNRPHVMLNRPSNIAGVVWMWIDRQDDARALFERRYQELLDRGEESGLSLLGLFASWLACWMGDLESGARYAESSLEASVHDGGVVARAAALAAQAMVNGHAGDVEATRRQAPEAAALFQESGWMLPSIWPTWMLGFVDLSAGDPAAAHRVLGPVSRFVVATDPAEPCPAPSIPDDIEALIALGELDEAEALLGWLEERGRRLNRAWALATAGRCRALLHAANGDFDEAVVAVEAALVHNDRIPLPIDRGRTLLVKGQLERRRNHKAAAKLALEEASATFDSVGSVLWAEQARRELARNSRRTRGTSPKA